MGDYLFIIDIVFLVTIVLGLLGGLIRGLGRNVNRIITLGVPMVLLFIFINPISNGIMNKKVKLQDLQPIIEMIPGDSVPSFSEEDMAKEYSLKDGITIIVGQKIYAEDPSLAQDSKVVDLVAGVSQMVIKVIVYIVGVVLVFILDILLRFILWIVRKICRIKLKRKHHLLGMATSVVNVALLFVLIDLPLFGLVSLGSQVIQDIDANKEVLNMDEAQIAELKGYSDAYENIYTKKYFLNPLTNILCTEKEVSFDAQYVGNALSFEVNGTKVKFFEEYNQVRTSLPGIMKLYNTINRLQSTGGGVISLSEFTDQEIDAITNILKNSNIVKVVLPVAVELGINKYQGSGSDYTALLTKLKDVNWETELNALADLVAVLKSHKDVTIDLNNFNSILTSNGFIDLLEDITDKTFKVSIVNDIVLPIAVLTLEQKYLEAQFAEFNIDFSGLKNINWETDGGALLTTIFTVYKDYLNKNINFSDMKVTLNDPLFLEFIDNAFTQIQSSNIIKDNLLPIAMQIAIAKLQTSGQLDGIALDFESLKQVNWGNELPSISASLVNIVKAYQTLGIDPSDMKAVLKNPELQNQLTVVVNSLLDVDVIKQYILPVLMNKVIDSLETNPSLQEFGFDFVNLRKVNWAVELPNFTNCVNTFLGSYQVLDINPDDFKAVLKNPLLQTELPKLIDSFLSVNVVKENILPGLMNKLIATLEANPSLQDFGFDFAAIKATNWAEEIKFVSNAMVEFLNMYQDLNIDFKHFADVLDNPELANYITNFMNEAVKSNVVKNQVLPALSNKIHALIDSSSFAEFDITFIKEIITNDSIITLLTTDVNNLVDVLKELKALGVIGSDGSSTGLDFTNPTVQASLTTMIKKVFGLSVIDGKQATIFNSVLQMVKLDQTLANAGIIINTAKVTDWNAEIDTLCTLFVDVMTLANGGDLDFNTIFTGPEALANKELIANIIATFASSQSFGDSIYTLIDTAISAANPEYTVTFTEADKLAIEKETGWKKEVITVLNILDKAKDITGSLDYKTLDAELVKSIMLEASNGVIASKAFGTVLNSLFAGVLDIDFTNRATIKDSAQAVYDAINLANMMANTSLDLTDPANSKELVSSIKGLASSDTAVEIANQVLKDFVDPSLGTLTKTDVTEAATAVEDVLASYQAAPNPSEFKLTDLTPEQIQAVENSKLAKAIVGNFFK